MKKVFSIGKMMNWAFYCGPKFWWLVFNSISNFTWVNQCQGKTKKEIEKEGYITRPEWMEKIK